MGSRCIAFSDFCSVLQLWQVLAEGWCYCQAVSYFPVCNKDSHSSMLLQMQVACVSFWGPTDCSEYVAVVCISLQLRIDLSNIHRSVWHSQVIKNFSSFTFLLHLSLWSFFTKNKLRTLWVLFFNAYVCRKHQIFFGIASGAQYCLAVMSRDLFIMFLMTILFSHKWLAVFAFKAQSWDLFWSVNTYFFQENSKKRNAWILEPLNRTMLI